MFKVQTHFSDMDVFKYILYSYVEAGYPVILTESESLFLYFSRNNMFSGKMDLHLAFGFCGVDCDEWTRHEQNSQKGPCFFFFFSSLLGKHRGRGRVPAHFGRRPESLRLLDSSIQGWHMENTQTGRIGYYSIS